MERKNVFIQHTHIYCLIRYEVSLLCSRHIAYMSNLNLYCSNSADFKRKNLALQMYKQSC